MECNRVKILVFLFLVAFARGRENKTVQETLESLDLFIRLNWDEEEAYQATVYSNFEDLREWMMNLTNNQKVMEKKVEDLQAGLDIVQDSQKVMEKKVEDLQAGLDIVQDQVAEQQQSSNSDDMLQVFSEILKYERDLQIEFWNTSCHVNDIAELHNNFSTGFQQIEGNINMVSSSVENQLSNITHLLAKELKQGQNLIKGSLNEVQQKVGESQRAVLGKVEELRDGQGILRGSQNEVKRTVEESQRAVLGKVEALRDGQGILQGSLNEVQQKVGELQLGQQGIQGVLCPPPARVVLPFGCVTPVTEMKTWSEAQENCERLGKTLLEGISSQGELELHTHFYTFLFGSSSWEAAWVGMKELTWVKGGDPAPPSSSSLWRPDSPEQPGSGLDCGFADFYDDGRAYLGDDHCSYSWSSLCQTKTN